MEYLHPLDLELEVCSCRCGDKSSKHQASSFKATPREEGGEEGEEGGPHCLSVVVGQANLLFSCFKNPVSGFFISMMGNYPGGPTYVD